MNINKEYTSEIRIRFSKIETAIELAQLLSWIYATKFPNKNDSLQMLIEERHLNYYAFKSTKAYKIFTIKKKNGGERVISAPKYKLKTIQKCLNEIFNALFVPKFYVTGFVPTKNIVYNAIPHVGKKYVYNTDLKDFFPSIEFRRIKTILCFSPFNLIDKNEKIANQEKRKLSNDRGRGYLGYLIANLCCENGCLPQGAPTSPTLTNLVCQRLDKKLNTLARTTKSTYSRYADDITFSSNQPIFNKLFTQNLKEIIEVQENFKINFAKERIQSNRERQSVTGIVVNQKTNVEKSYIKDIRFWLMCWNKFGTIAAQDKFLIEFPAKKGYLRYKKSTPQFSNHLNGKILFLGMVRGVSDPIYLKYKYIFEELSSRDNKKTTEVKINYNLPITPEAHLYKLFDIWKEEGIENAIKNYSNS